MFVATYASMLCIRVKEVTSFGGGGGGGPSINRRGA